MEIKNLTGAVCESNIGAIYVKESRTTFLGFFVFLVSLSFAVLTLPFSAIGGYVLSLALHRIY